MSVGYHRHSEPNAAPASAPGQGDVPWMARADPEGNESRVPGAGAAPAS
jgi:hypothetical protein